MSGCGVNVRNKFALGTQRLLAPHSFARPPLSTHRLSPEHKLIGNDHIHWNIVRLRMNRVQLCVNRGNPDGKRSARCGGKGSIIKHPITQPKYARSKPRGE